MNWIKQRFHEVEGIYSIGSMTDLNLRSYIIYCSFRILRQQHCFVCREMDFSIYFDYDAQLTLSWLKRRHLGTYYLGRFLMF